MPAFVSIPLAALMGYLIGCINPAYIIGRIKGLDIRRTGSGNAGASNAVIVLGKAVGVGIAVFDILKAFFAVKLAGWVFPSLIPDGAASGTLTAGDIAGAACILGHMFPIGMGFRGGKGLACLGGTILAYNPIVFLIMLACELVLALITDYICFVPITACVAFPLIVWLHSGRWLGAAVLAVASLAMFGKHIENLRRIRAGTEAHISIMWHKDAELQRIKANRARADSGKPGSTDPDDAAAPDESDRNDQT